MPRLPSTQEPSTSWWSSERVAEVRTGFTSDEARAVGEQIGIDWQAAPFDLEQFRTGITVELEHGRRDPTTNVTDDDPATTGRIALAHLNELSDYYTRLTRTEQEAERTRDR